MSIPSWFDPNAYFDNKLAATEGYNELTLTKAFADAGFSGDEGLYEHFVRFGASEGLSPNSYFNVDEYLFAKAQDYFNTTAVSQNQIRSMFLAFENAGMTPWEHYLQYGAAEGINPSNSFDNDLYLAAKLAQLQADEPDAGWTLDALNQALTDGGLTPLTHYMAYGVNEDLGTSFLNTGNVGTTQYLTDGQDSLFGTSGGDYFEAGIGQLSTNDYIDGGSGFDTLKAVLGNSPDGDVAIQPTILNVEKIIFQAQTNAGGGGSNANSASSNEVSVDAGNISGMTMLQNSNSRASLVVEDVRIDSTDLTVSWVDADPGRDVDYEVYFNPQNLTTQTAAESGTINIQLMDVRNAQLSAGDTPLLSQPWENFTFAVIDSNGNAQAITLALDSAKVTGADATYDTLLAAFQEALLAADPDNLYQLSADITGTFIGSATVDGNSYTWTGDVITLTSGNSSVSVDSSVYDFVGWSTNSGTTPPIGGIVWSAVSANETTCPLIQTNIDLDNVGRVQWGDAVAECLPDESWYGSEAGDMTVGSMANRGGVERFDVNVDRGSWISSLSSTNNTLRAVVVHDKDINGDGITGNVSSQSKESGDGESQLFIGRQLDADGSVHDQNLWGPSSWTDKAVLLSTDGLQDVKYFSVYDDNGSLSYTGNVNLGASITAASYEKYLKDVDGVDTTTEGYAPNGAFQYTFGDKADILNMTVESGVAVDNDFVMNISMGGGDDLVNFSYTGGLTDNQLLGMRAKLLQLNSTATTAPVSMTDNVNIDTGAGNDEVWSWGNGVVNVNAGSGDDAVYVGQNADDQNAVFVFNGTSQIYVDAVNGAQPLNNDALGDVAVFNQTGLTSGNTVYVRVSFGDVESALVAIGTVGSTATTLNVGADVVNRAIIAAIENDAYLSNLFAAKDGAGYSLLIEALFNHDFAAATNTLSIDFFEGATAATATTAVAGALDTAYGTNDFATMSSLVLDSQAAADASTGLVTLTASAATVLQVADGDSVVLTVDGVNYSYTNTTGAALADDAAFVAAIASATDASGNTLGASYIIADSGAAGDGAFSIASKIGSLNYASLSTVTTGTDADGSGGAGTNSYNVVEGGLGNDTLVLNANAASAVAGTDFIDVLKISGAFGDDVVVNFDTGHDMLDVRALLNTGAVTANTSVTGLTGANNAILFNQATAAATAASGEYSVADLFTAMGWTSGTTAVDANLKGVVVLQNYDGAALTDTYTVFQIINNSDATLATSEVTVLGTITMADDGVITGTADLIHGL